MQPDCLNMTFLLFITSLPHNLIKYKRIDLIERTFQTEGSPYSACNDSHMLFSYFRPAQNIIHGPGKMYVICRPICWTTFVYNLALSCIGKL